MSSPIVAPPSQPEPHKPSALSGLLNVFVDPAITAAAVPRPWFWLWPLLVSSAVAIAAVLVTIPLTLHVMQINPPPNVPVGGMDRALSMTTLVMKILAAAMPLLIGGMLALYSLLASGILSATATNVRFRDMCSLLSACGLILALQGIATIVVLRVRENEIQSMAELQPAFGLDIFVGDGLGKPLLAVLNFFSIFEVWYLIVATVGVAALARCSKAKALIAITPVWLVPLLFKVVGALLQR